MKLMIWLGVAIGGTIGGAVGAAIDQGNWLGVWSILLTTLGSLAGLWVSYKLNKAYF